MYGIAQRIKGMIAVLLTAALLLCCPVTSTYAAEGDGEDAPAAQEQTSYSNKTPALTALKKKNKTIDFTSYVPLKYKRNARVAQAATTDGKYVYCFYQKGSSNNVVIVKINLKTKKKVKTSKVLRLNHANDATYNPDTKKLVVVHWNGHPYRVSFVDPKTLKVTGFKDIRPTMQTENMTQEVLSSIKSYAGITYNSNRKQYAMRISNSDSLLILDRNLNPVKYVSIPSKGNERHQGLDSDNDRIFNYKDKKGHHNAVYVYDWDGKYLYKVMLNSKYEIQSVFHSGSAYYAFFYRGHNVRKGCKTYYKRSSYIYRLGGI